MRRTVWGPHLLVGVLASLCMGKAVVAGSHACAPEEARSANKPGAYCGNEAGLPGSRGTQVAMQMVEGDIAARLNEINKPRPGNSRPGGGEEKTGSIRVHNLRCQGAICEVAGGMDANSFTFELKGGQFAANNGTSVQIVTSNTQGEIIDERFSEVANGSISLSIPVSRLPLGAYGMLVRPRGRDDFMAVGSFSVGFAPPTWQSRGNEAGPNRNVWSSNTPAERRADESVIYSP